MKKRGIFLGAIFVMLMVVVFQSEISGFMTSMREKAYEAANVEENTVSALEELDETESNNNKNENEDNGSAPPLPQEDSKTTDNGDDSNAGTENDEQVTADITYKEVMLYFVDEQTQAIAAEEREIVKSDSIAKTTLAALLEGPETDSLTSYIPKGTEITSMNISGGLCTVDFNKNLQNKDLTSSEERYVLASIVETLCQFDSVDKVQIRINGNATQSLAGHWDISKPLSAASFQ